MFICTNSLLDYRVIDLLFTVYLLLCSTLIYLIADRTTFLKEVYFITPFTIEKVTSLVIEDRPSLRETLFYTAQFFFLH